MEFLTQERERYHQNPHKKLTRQRLFRVANQASVAAGMHRHYVQNKARYAAKVAARRAARINATPSWCDKAAIVELYREARRLTVETGIRHEVDHIVPLVGRNVCGLHIPQNMRVITRLENRRKFNRLIDAGGPHENPSEHRISG